MTFSETPMRNHVYQGWKLKSKLYNKKIFNDENR